MPTPTIDFSITFQLNQSPKSILVSDLSDYTGYDTTGHNARLKITAPDGSDIYNTATSTPFPISDVSVSLPLLSDGSIEPGNYVVEYTLTDALSAEVAKTTKSYDFCYEAPEVEIEVTSDCVLPELVSNDVTVYTFNSTIPTITRDHRVYYPSELDLAFQSNTSKSLTLTSFYTGTQTSKITSTLSYDFGNNIFIEDEVSGSQEHKVVCDTTLCDLYCCLHQLYLRYKENKGINQTKAEDYKKRFVEAMGIRSLIKDSYECNKGENVSEFVADVKRLAECTSGCGCDGDAPVPVIGLGGAGTGGGSGTTTIVDTLGNGIVVASNTVGDTTTYTLSLESSLISKINGLRNTTLNASSSVVEVTSSTDVDGNITYTISDLPSSVPSSYSLFAQIVFTPGALPVINVTGEEANGSDFQIATAKELYLKEPGSFLPPPPNDLPNYLRLPNNFRINGMNVSGGFYAPQISIVNSVLTPISKKFAVAPDINYTERTSVNFTTVFGDWSEFAIYMSDGSSGVRQQITGYGIDALLADNKASSLKVTVSISITK